MSSSYQDNNITITGNYILGLPYGDFKMKTEEYEYSGPYIYNGFTAIGSLVTNKYKFHGHILRFNNTFVTGNFGTMVYNDGSLSKWSKNDEDMLKFEVTKMNGENIKGFKFAIENAFGFAETIYSLPNGDIAEGIFIVYIRRSKSLYCKNKGKITRSNGDVFKGIFEVLGNGHLEYKYGENIQSTFVYVEGNLKSDSKNFRIKNGVIENEENNLDINCPKCRQFISFKLSNHKMYESDINPDKICEICMENPRDMVTPCMHFFCQQCIVKCV